MKREILKLFKVYYFTGDPMSSEGETMHICYERAESEEELENLYLNGYLGNTDEHYGWAEEVKKRG